MGRKLVREKDMVERFRQQVMDTFETCFLFVADEAEGKGVGIERVHTLCWAMPSGLTKGQLERIREFMVSECGAVVTAAFSLPGGLSEDLESDYQKDIDKALSN